MEVAVKSTRIDAVVPKEHFNASLRASRDPFAYLHEGMHVEVNAAYCALFRLTAEDIGGLSIIDLVTPRDRLDLKRDLRRIAGPRPLQGSYRWRRPDDTEFDAAVELSACDYAGEKTVRLIIRRQVIDAGPAVDSGLWPAGAPNQRCSQVKVPATATRPAAVAPFKQQMLVGERPHIEYQPIVSLEGETRADYRIVVPAWETHSPQRYDYGQVIEPAYRSDHLTGLRRWALRHAVSDLSKSRQKACLHLHLSHEVLSDEMLLAWICETLRSFNIRGNSLYFCFEAALLLEKNLALKRFLDGLKKINCRITCSNVTPDHDIPGLLSENGVAIAQYAASTISGALQTSQQMRTLGKFNQRVQQAGIKTQAGGVNEARTLALLWELGVNAAWGDFLQAPTNVLGGDEDV